MSNDTVPAALDFAGRPIEFAPWPTPIDGDRLSLGRISFGGSPDADLPREGVRLALPDPGSTRPYTLEVSFLSLEKRAVIDFAFHRVIAFRVLDENGLIDLWQASSITSRPASTTFRARGHKWNEESFLVFLDAGDEPRFSYFIATSDTCLEVVCYDEPIVTVSGPAVVTELPARA